MTEKNTNQKSNIIKIGQLLIVATGIVFANFAPVPEKWSFYTLLAAYLVAMVGVVYQFVISIKKGDILNKYLFIVIATVMLLYFKNYMESTITLWVFLLFDFINETITIKKRDKLDKLKNILPKFATIVIDDAEVKIPAKELVVGHIVLVKPDEMIVADGVVFQGNSRVDFSTLVGNRDIRSVKKGEKVFAGTINKDKTLQIEVKKLAISQIEEELVETAFEEENRSLIFRLYDMRSRAIEGKSNFIEKTKKLAIAISIILVVAGVVMAFGVPYFAGFSYSKWVGRGMVLVAIASFSELGITGYFTISSYLGDLFKGGIFLKRPETLKDVKNLGEIILEKNQEFTEGRYELDHIKEQKYSKVELLTFAAHLESFGRNPIGEVIVDGYLQAAKYEGIEEYPIKANIVKKFEDIKGKGVAGVIGGKSICVGNEKLMELLNLRDLPKEEGFELVHIAIDQEYCGYFALKYIRKDGVQEIFDAFGEADINKIAMINDDMEETFETLLEDKNKKSKLALVGTKSSEFKELQVDNRIDLKIAMDILERENGVLTEDLLFMSSDLMEIAFLKDSVKGFRSKLYFNLIVDIVLKLAVAGVAVIMAMPLWVAVAGVSVVELLTLINTKTKL